MNPFLPLDAYIPDGEPHAIGDRVYLFGSHDAEDGTTICSLDYARKNSASTAIDVVGTDELVLTWQGRSGLDLLAIAVDDA